MTTSDQRVLIGKVDHLISQQPLSFLANGINSLLLAVLLIGAWPELWLGSWMIAIWGITGLRGAIWLRYRAGCKDQREAATAARALTATVFLAGVVWGLPGALFPPQQVIVLEGFVVFVLGGMAAGAVVTLGSHLPAFFAFALPAFGPMLVQLATDGRPICLVMSIMGVVFLWVIINAARDLNRTLTRNMTLQIEKSDLVEELTQARLQAEAASAAKSSFLAMIGHELRTPLNAVLGFGQLMEQEVHGPVGHQKYREYLGHMGDSGAHLLQLIDEVMDISRADTGQLELHEAEVDFAPLVESTGELMMPHAHRTGLALEIDVAADLPWLRADPKRLRQILLNVLNNAIKFTPDGGQVRMTARQVPSGDVTVLVRDSGIGMSKEDLKVAFEFFGRGHNATERVIEGTGIGLPLTRYLLALHGAEMELASEPGKGTLVTLRFPAHRVIDSPNDPARVVPMDPKEVAVGAAL